MHPRLHQACYSPGAWGPCERQSNTQRQAPAQEAPAAAQHSADCPSAAGRHRWGLGRAMQWCTGAQGILAVSEVGLHHRRCRTRCALVDHPRGLGVRCWRCSRTHRQPRPVCQSRLQTHGGCLPGTTITRVRGGRRRSASPSSSATNPCRTCYQDLPRTARDPSA